MQHIRAVNIIERAEVFGLLILDLPAQKCDVLQPARRSATLRGQGRWLRRIEVNDFPAAVAELLGEIQRLVASARASGQKPGSRSKSLLAAEDEMIDPFQRLHWPDHKPPALVLWVSLRRRMLLIEREEVGVGGAVSHYAVSRSMAGEEYPVEEPLTRPHLVD
jgi:hypothetical protein